MAKALANNFLGAMSTVVGLPNPRVPPVNPEEDRIITLDELSYHDERNDCWVVIYDRVYDVTNFMDEHPGGDDILLEYAGRDATFAFRGSRHSQYALRALSKYYIGVLPMEERIFRKPGGFKVTDMPE